MKRIVILFLAALFAASGASAQKFHNAYYDTRRAAHDEEGLQQGAIVFLGNSITEQGWWSLLLKRGDVENRGIGGDNTFGMIDRLPDILKSKPRKIFLMAGINDLTGGQPVDTIVMNITRMADMVHEAVPGCRLYIQSVLPVNTRRLAYPGLKGHNPQVRTLNARLVQLCDAKPWCTFVDLVPLLSDADGELRIDLTKDGIHLHPDGKASLCGRFAARVGYRGNGAVGTDPMARRTSCMAVPCAGAATVVPFRSVGAGNYVGRSGLPVFPLLDGGRFPAGPA